MTVRVIKIPMFHCGRCMQPLKFEPISPKEVVEKSFVVGWCADLRCDAHRIRARVPMEILECPEDDIAGAVAGVVRVIQ